MATTVKAMLAAANEAVPKIDPDQAKAMVEKGEALVVDVRDPQEVAASGKVRGALNVSRGMLEFRADPDSPYHDKAFDRGKPVLVYCASGGRSALAGKTLKELGYGTVLNAGGFKDLAEAGVPTEPAEVKPGGRPEGPQALPSAATSASSQSRNVASSGSSSRPRSANRK